MWSLLEVVFIVSFQYVLIPKKKNIASLLKGDYDHCREQTLAIVQSNNETIPNGA